MDLDNTQKLILTWFSYVFGLCLKLIPVMQLISFTLASIISCLIIYEKLKNIYKNNNNEKNI